MRKPGLYFKWLIFFLIIPSFCFAGLPYVKNLHKVCVSDHQDCALACASAYQDEIGESISKDAEKCIDVCIESYKKCEYTLAKMRRLNELKHFDLEDSYQYKPIIEDEDED